VAPRRVVERLDVIEDGKLSVMAAGGNRHIEPAVGLEGAPKGLHRRIIVDTISLFSPARCFTIGQYKFALSEWWQTIPDSYRSRSMDYLTRRSVVAQYSIECFHGSG
jgi:hypothetical protein